MGGRTVISPTARGWRIRRRWRGLFPPDTTPIHAVLHRSWLAEASCLGIPPERWVWQVAGWRESVQAVEQVAAALARDDPSPSPGTPNCSSTCRRRDDHPPGDPAEGAPGQVVSRSPALPAPLRFQNSTRRCGSPAHTLAAATHQWRGDQGTALRC